jgi:hypothetical protein
MWQPGNTLKGKEHCYLWVTLLPSFSMPECNVMARASVLEQVANSLKTRKGQGIRILFLDHCGATMPATITQCLSEDFLMWERYNLQSYIHHCYLEFHSCYSRTNQTLISVNTFHLLRELLFFRRHLEKDWCKFC